MSSFHKNAIDFYLSRTRLVSAATKWPSLPEHLGLPNEEIAVTQEPETPRRAKPPTAKSIRTPLILVGVLGGVFLLCCGGFGVMAFFGSRIGKATQTNLAEADALWTPAATGVYSLYDRMLALNAPRQGSVT